MYSGRTDLVANWFTEKLGYDYDPKIHGVVSDWVIDLVSIGFSKPDQFYGKSMRTEKELLDAASKFYREYKALKQAEGRGGDEETGDAGVSRLVFSCQRKNRASPFSYSFWLGYEDRIVLGPSNLSYCFLLSRFNGLQVN